MDFKVPRGGSAICHIDVYPVEPVNGSAQNWKMVNTSVEPPQELDTLEISFALASTPQQRQSERMILVFSIADAVQTAADSWRFAQGGTMYCEGKADYLNDIDFELSGDGKVLTASIQCLTDIPEAFNFSFLAIRRDNKSGECHLFSSADPGGGVRRL